MALDLVTMNSLPEAKLELAGIGVAEGEADDFFRVLDKNFDNFNDVFRASDDVIDDGGRILRNVENQSDDILTQLGRESDDVGEAVAHAGGPKEGTSYADDLTGNPKTTNTADNPHPKETEIGETTPHKSNTDTPEAEPREHKSHDESEKHKTHEDKEKPRESEDHNSHGDTEGHEQHGDEDIDGENHHDDYDGFDETQQDHPLEDDSETGNLSDNIDGDKNGVPEIKNEIKNPIDSFDYDTASKKYKCNFGENKSDYNMTHNEKIKDAGYTLKSIGRKAPQSLDEKLAKGIDGVYKNTNPESNIKYVIDESKFGTSQLGTTKDGLQMSYDWLTGAYTGNDRILSAVKDEEVANEIRRALKRGQVESVLSQVDKDGNVVTYLLDNDGKVIRKWP